ncbi:MAG TPA: hypothetical protein VMJ92_01895 [Candidatus Limnocylindrales bacterium]|nr:hypothetical protein [Candidatus Limnocylindrales bacterium]
MAERERPQARRAEAPSPEPLSDAPEAVAQQAREAVEKQAAELRKRSVPIETEPPTVYRP